MAPVMGLPTGFLRGSKLMHQEQINGRTSPCGLVEMPEPGTPALAHGLLTSKRCFHGYDDVDDTSLGLRID